LLKKKFEISKNKKFFLDGPRPKPKTHEKKTLNSSSIMPMKTYKGSGRIKN
jgi:hypothetical protein